MSDKNVVTIVSQEISESMLSMFRSLNIEAKKIKSIGELFPLISDSNFYTDLILIDIDACYSKDSSLFDLINTISTLLGYTVCRPRLGEKPVKRSVYIGAIVTEHTDIKLIRETLRASVTGLYQCDSNSTEEMSSAIVKLLNGQRYIPDSVQERLNSSRKVNKKPISEIKLTVRQREILNLIRERGCSNKVIARILNITESTVKLHVSAILKKYNVRTRTQLAIFADKQ